MYSDHFPINRDRNYHIYPRYFFWKVLRGCIAMTSLLKDLHLKGCCSNLIHIWHNVFSCRTLPSIWKNQFSASSSLRPTDHFSFYYGYILSEFSVCSGNDINNQKMFTSFLQPHFDFLTCASCTVFSLASAAHSVLGFPGFRSQNKHSPVGGTSPVGGESR